MDPITRQIIYNEHTTYLIEDFKPEETPLARHAARQYDLAPRMAAEFHITLQQANCHLELAVKTLSPNSIQP